jgi:peptide chain release factor 2
MRSWTLFGGPFDIERKVARKKEISELESLDGFWNDTTNAAKIQKEKAVLENVTKSYFELKEMIEEFEMLNEYALVENSSEYASNAIELFSHLGEKVDEAEQKVLLAEELDPNNAIVTINAGAGGTESCDWAGMLHRMVSRWAETHKFKVAVQDYQYGDSAGIKSLTMTINGAYAFGLLKSESGIHRLVRISPFDSNARRHTSFAAISVVAEVDDDIEIEVLDKDLKIDVFRSGGAGGQSVNTTDSAVRITHLPTGIVVNCQNERSQLQNKMQGMKILKSRLYERAMEEKRAKQDAVEAAKKDNSWGSQIRSYVLHPYKMVKDHRTGFTSGTPDKVLDGDLDDFIKKFLQWKVSGAAAVGADDLE